MIIKTNALVEWITEKCGGHRANPSIGLRPLIRFQRHIKEFLDEAFCAQILSIEQKSEGIYWMQLQFAENLNINQTWLEPGQFIELLDVYRVIAVGVLQGDAG